MSMGIGIGIGGGGGSGASTALDNLASVAINTSLISDTDNTDDLGSAAKNWRNIYFATQAVGPLGTKTAPTYSATGDLNTGVYFPGADRVGLSCGDTRLFEATLLTSNWTNNVGGGTAYPNGLFVDAGKMFSSAVSAYAVPDTGLYAVAAGVFATCGAATTNIGGFQPAQSANGCNLRILTISESLTLSTSGTTTDTAADLLPANALILSVMGRVTTTITTATSWQIGDPTTAGRFTAANATMTANTTDTGRVHATTGVASATTGLWQGAAAKVRITTVGTPGAGVVRLTTTYILLTPPTS